MYKRIPFAVFLLAALWMIPFVGNASAKTPDSTFRTEFVLVNETGKTIRDIYWANDSCGLYDAKGMLAAPLPDKAGMRVKHDLPCNASANQYGGVWTLGAIFEDGSSAPCGNFDFRTVHRIILNKDGSVDVRFAPRKDA